MPADSLSLVRLLGDLAWLHIFLARLTVLGFPSPVPLPSFGGKSWAMAEGMFWEIVSFLARPDEGWAGEPPREESALCWPGRHGMLGHLRCQGLDVSPEFYCR